MEDDKNKEKKQIKFDDVAELAGQGVEISLKLLYILGEGIVKGVSNIMDIVDK